jgi:hypothetical protein
VVCKGMCGKGAWKGGARGGGECKGDGGEKRGVQWGCEEGMSKPKVTLGSILTVVKQFFSLPGVYKLRVTLAINLL